MARAPDSSAGDGAPFGAPAVYAAESRALCILERLVHLVRLPRDEGFSRILIPAEIASVRLKQSELPDGWNNPVETELTHRPLVLS